MGKIGSTSTFKEVFFCRVLHTECRERFSSALLSSPPFLQQAVLLLYEHTDPFHFISLTVKETGGRAIMA